VWDESVERQAIKRADRIGQSQQVIVEKIIIRDTIEEKILDMLQPSSVSVPSSPSSSMASNGANDSLASIATTSSNGGDSPSPPKVPSKSKGFKIDRERDIHNTLASLESSRAVSMCTKLPLLSFEHGAHSPLESLRQNADSLLEKRTLVRQNQAGGRPSPTAASLPSNSLLTAPSSMSASKKAAIVANKANTPKSSALRLLQRTEMLGSADALDDNHTLLPLLFPTDFKACSATSGSWSNANEAFPGAGAAAQQQQHHHQQGSGATSPSRTQSQPSPTREFMEPRRLTAMQSPTRKRAQLEAASSSPPDASSVSSPLAKRQRVH